MNIQIVSETEISLAERVEWEESKEFVWILHKRG